MTEETPPPAPPGDSSPSPFASPWFIAAAGVVAVLVVMGLVVTTTTLMGDDAAESSGSGQQSQGTHEGQIGEEEYPQNPTASEVPHSDGSQSVCGLTPGEGTDFTAWPADTSWETAGVMKAPTSTVHGPGEVEDSGYRHCYAKSPSGAVFAALNFVAMGTDPLIAPDLAEHMYAEGAGKEAAQEDLDRNGASDQRVLAHFGGAKLMTYSSDRARVETALILENVDDAISATTVDLRWEEGDWKIVARDDGTMVIPPVVIHSLDGYILAPAGKEE